MIVSFSLLFPKLPEDSQHYYLSQMENSVLSSFPVLTGFPYTGLRSGVYLYTSSPNVKANTAIRVREVGSDVWS